MENGHGTPQAPNGEANGEGKIGRVLKQARRDRGLSLEEAERATKIRKRYLAGLEHDDYTVLPDAVYARGFLRTYANFLGLDGEGLSRELKSRRKPRRERGINYEPPKSDFERPILTPGGVGGTEKRRVPVSTIVTLAIAILVVAALIGALYYVGRGVQADLEKDSGVATQATGEPASAPASDPTPRRDGAESTASSAARGASPGDRAQNTRTISNDAPLDTLAVGVEVEGSASWILVESDSEVVFENVASPGFFRTFRADRSVSISTGNAGAVSVRVNGQDAGPLGAGGEVLTRSFTLKNSS